MDHQISRYQHWNIQHEPGWYVVFDLRSGWYPSCHTIKLMSNYIIQAEKLMKCNWPRKELLLHNQCWISKLSKVCTLISWGFSLKFSFYFQTKLWASERKKTFVWNYQPENQSVFQRLQVLCRRFHLIWNYVLSKHFHVIYRVPTAPYSHLRVIYRFCGTIKFPCHLRGSGSLLFFISMPFTGFRQEIFMPVLAAPTSHFHVIYMCRSVCSKFPCYF